ncbi:unnamed protein product [Mytilus edulis]|uniref:Uncharacterized protein n=1 Tax=Mytilus edulis TaxID=6550 RepID=A0A8S3QYV7_MYTED|nr:unnamed protein product [Mytilus edulis]
MDGTIGKIDQINDHHDHCYFVRTTGKPQTERAMEINNENKHDDESELKDRNSTTFQNLVPFLFNILCTVVGKMCSADGMISIDKIAPIVSAYAILMKSRCEQLSAWHRLTTLVATTGHVEDRFHFLYCVYQICTPALARFNKLGITLSTISKIRLLDEAANNAEKAIVKELQTNPLVKITGDNLDIYVSANHQSTEKLNKDLHLFASNIIFSRLAGPDLDNRNPQLILQNLHPERFLPHDSYKSNTDALSKYKVIIGGDQLTKVNLQEKAYKELYQQSSLRQPCTLYHFEANLQRGDVNGKVKGKFKQHNELLLCVGKAMIKEQALEYFGMENEDSDPNIITSGKSKGQDI